MRRDRLASFWPTNNVGSTSFTIMPNGASGANECPLLAVSSLIADGRISTEADLPGQKKQTSNARLRRNFMWLRMAPHSSAGDASNRISECGG
jgi:hypothetical protein